MQKIILAGAVAAALLSGCASGPTQEMTQCLQPNRRVVVEVVGTVLPPPPKPKPEAKPEAGAAAKPAAKPAPAKKPEPQPLELSAMAQGDSAFDVGSAVLKPTGREDLDEMLATISKRKMNVGAIVLAGHTDRFEAQSANASLAEERAKSVMNYLTSKGMDQKLMFWEGKGAKEPVPVTKFCDDK